MCYFTFCFRLHKVVTAICLTHLNCHYSDILRDDILGCTQCCLPSWVLNNKVSLAGDSNTAVIFSWKPIAAFFFLNDIHKLLTHNMPPFVSLISAFYPFFCSWGIIMGISVLITHMKTHFCFSVKDFLLCSYLQWALSLPLASDKGSKKWQGLFVMGMRQGWHTLDYKKQRRAEVR